MELILVIVRDKAELRVYLLLAEERSGGRNQGTMVSLFYQRELCFATVLLALSLTRVFRLLVEKQD